MRCHARSASVPKIRRPPSLSLRRAVIFDLANPMERTAHDAIQRIHGGPSPLCRAHAMRRVDNVVFAVATNRLGWFALVKWIMMPTALELRWCRHPTLAAARVEFSQAGGAP